MVDQVNPTGSLAPVLILTPQVATRPQPVQDTSVPVNPARPQPTRLEGGPAPASGPSLDSAVQQVKDFFQQSQSQQLQFQVDPSSGETVFKIVDPQTKEVIRQVPSEDILAMARKLRELDQSKGASGVLVDKEG
jgi:flagellar protein FlaG